MVNDNGLRPRRACIPKFNWWRGEDSNLRRLSRQIYSLIPLTAREPLQIKRRMLAPVTEPVNLDLAISRPHTHVSRQDGVSFNML